MQNTWDCRRYQIEWPICGGGATCRWSAELNTRFVIRNFIAVAFERGGTRNRSNKGHGRGEYGFYFYVCGISDSCRNAGDEKELGKAENRDLSQNQSGDWKDGFQSARLTGSGVSESGTERLR